jgi:hypothetical protein
VCVWKILVGTCGVGNMVEYKSIWDLKCLLCGVEPVVKRIGALHSAKRTPVGPELVSLLIKKKKKDHAGQEKTGGGTESIWKKDRYLLVSILHSGVLVQFWEADWQINKKKKKKKKELQTFFN